MSVEIYKILPVDTPNQIFIKHKVLCTQVFDSLEHFRKTKECNEIDLLFLSVWKKLGNKNI